MVAPPARIRGGAAGDRADRRRVAEPRSRRVRHADPGYHLRPLRRPSLPRRGDGAARKLAGLGRPALGHGHGPDRRAVGDGGLRRRVRIAGRARAHRSAQLVAPDARARGDRRRRVRYDVHRRVRQLQRRGTGLPFDSRLRRQRRRLHHGAVRADAPSRRGGRDADLRGGFAGARVGTAGIATRPGCGRDGGGARRRSGTARTTQRCVASADGSARSARRERRARVPCVLRRDGIRNARRVRRDSTGALVRGDARR